MNPQYPFAAIVGQEEMKLGLVLSAVDPRIGGVLIMGHRGTGKSTAVRALADVLPAIRRVRGCAYGCDPEGADLCAACSAARSAGRCLTAEHRPVPVVELPLGTTEDRLCGSLDIERALNSGVKAFEPGLLARAHRGFLYIDEVNLLEDHLVDLLLDVSASGRNIVEREGIGVSHPAYFVLVGSGNPEEGELRPQLLDRFGLHVRIETIADVQARVEIISRRERFERDPGAFLAEMEPEQARLRRRIVRARTLLPRVLAPPQMLSMIAALCLRLSVIGHRGELTVLRAAKALASFEGRKQATEDDVRRVAVMSLYHRLRRDLHGEMDPGTRIRHALSEMFPSKAKEERKDLILPPADAVLPPGLCDAAYPDSNGRGNHRAGEGRGESRRPQMPGRGRLMPARPGACGASTIALGATLRAAAPLQKVRRHACEPKVRIHPADLRYEQRKSQPRFLIIFVIDASGSMALNRIREAKGAIQRLLEEVYRRRHKVAVVSFRRGGAEVLLAPTRSVECARRAMDELAVGGGTPLAAGIGEALTLSCRARDFDGRQSLLVLFTDGCANLTRAGGSGGPVWRELEGMCSVVRSEHIPSVVIDTRQPFLSSGEGRKLADLLDARYVSLPIPDAAAIYGSIVDSVGVSAARTG